MSITLGRHLVALRVLGASWAYEFHSLRSLKGLGRTWLHNLEVPLQDQEPCKVSSCWELSLSSYWCFSPPLYKKQYSYVCGRGLAMALYSTRECVTKSMATPSMSSSNLPTHPAQSILTVGRCVALAPEKATGEANKLGHVSPQLVNYLASAIQADVFKHL